MTILKDAKGIIWDVDGTLVDSNDLHAEAWLEILRSHGYDVEFLDVRKLIGMGGDKLLPKLVGVSEESPEGKALADARSKLFLNAYIDRVEAFPGAKELLAKLAHAGRYMVVASSSGKDQLTNLLEKVGGTQLFEDETSSDDAEHSKPDPDIVVAALRKLPLKREQVVMIGDTPYDIEAAKAAGVRIIALRSGGWSDDDLRGADEIQNDVKALLEALSRENLTQDAS